MGAPPEAGGPPPSCLSDVGEPEGSGADQALQLDPAPPLPSKVPNQTMAPEQPGIFVALSFYARLTVSVPAVVFSASLKADRLTSPFTGWLIKK